MPKKYNRPNVVLISLDTLRADHLGCYGYSRNTSPNIDRIARNGTIFKNAIAQAPWTAPSHISLFTSTYPIQHGVESYSNLRKLSRRFVTLAERLKESGYITAGFTGGAFMSGEIGFDRGFDVYNDISNKKGDIKYSSGYVFDWLSQNYKEKFFLFIHCFDIHQYNPPEPYNKLFCPNYQGKIKPSKELVFKINDSYGGFFETLSKEDVEFIISLYDGAIAYVDSFIGKLVEKLKEHNIYDRTIIIITSDHGEAFNEHGKTGHGFILYDELIRIPLVMKGPGIPKKMEIEQTVRQIDIMPTILELLDIHLNNEGRLLENRQFIKFLNFLKKTKQKPVFKKTPLNKLCSFIIDSFEKEKIQGKSLVPLINGKEKTNLYAFTTSGFTELVSVRTNEWKLILKQETDEKRLREILDEHKMSGHEKLLAEWKGKNELYNIKKDPFERNNLIDVYPDIAQRLEGEIREFLKSHAPIKANKLKMSDTMRNQLKGLGYF